MGNEREAMTLQDVRNLLDMAINVTAGSPRVTLHPTRARQARDAIDSYLSRAAEPVAWVPVCGYEGYYDVSSAGDIRSRKSGRILAGLPEDVREHVANMDAHNTVNGSWNAVRAELLRLARENADLHKTFDAKTVHVSIPSPTMYAEFENYARPFKQRAERAEAELAAVKKRIAVNDDMVRRAMNAEWCDRIVSDCLLMGTDWGEEMMEAALRAALLPLDDEAKG